MAAYQELVHKTTTARQSFVELPLIREVLQNGASKVLYLDFLGQAYHHVKHTAPLLGLAAARCRSEDHLYQAALFQYIEEEHGHELWILEDIAALGGNPDAARRGSPRLPCKVMVGHAYYVVDHVSPYALLGMIHVLEGMAVALAGKVASVLRGSIASSREDAGFKYLTTHSDLDIHHAEFFEKLINAVDRHHMPVVIETTGDFYKLYGDIFRDLDARRALDRGGPVEASRNSQ